MGHVEIVKSMIDEGAQTDWGDYLKQGLWRAAAKTGHIDCIRLLVEHGANFE